MKVSVRKVTPYYAVTIKEQGTTIDVGFLDDKERRLLAQTFLLAAEELLDGLKEPK